MHLKGTCDDEARELLARFHHHNLETVEEEAGLRRERERQWAATLARIDELAAGNRNGRIFAQTVERAIAECWRLPIITPPAASSPAPPVTAAASEPDVVLDAEAPAAYPAILLACDDGQYVVSVETPYGWVEVIRDQGPFVHHVAEPHGIAELVQRAAELAGAAAAGAQERGTA